MSKEKLQTFKEHLSESYAFGHGYGWLTDTLTEYLKSEALTKEEKTELVTHLVTNCAFESGRDYEFGLSVRKNVK
jgi:hypothetical protein